MAVKQQGFLGFERENALIRQGFLPVAGVDEAGRGPLAGPVVAAAVILDPLHLPQGLDDSKKLTEARREALFAEILATSLVGIASASPRQIDQTDIRKASLAAMTRAVRALARPPRIVLVDGRDEIALPPLMRCEAVIGGDGLIASIAAASIVAKVMRDRMMAGLETISPGYGFDIHKGYGTKQHREALARRGISPDHRRTFGTVRRLAEGGG